MGRSRKGHNKGNLITAASTANGELRSENPNEREWACSSLAHIFLEEPLSALQPLTETQSLEQLVKLTNDAEVSVVTAAAGALRNLTLALPDEQCRVVVDAILAYNGLVPLLTKLDQTVLSPDDEKEEIKAKDAMLCQVVGLLSNLIQGSPSANQAIGMANILPLIAKYLQPHLFTQDLMIGCCDFLLSLTENNPVIQQKLTPDFVNLLKVTMANANNCLLVRVLAIAVLCNLLQPQDLLGLLKLGLPLMTNSLTSFDPIVAWQQIQAAKLQHAQLSEQVNKAAVDDADELTTKMKKAYAEAARMVDQWKQAIETQTVCLEVVANLLSGPDGDDEDEFMELDENDASLEHRLSAHGPSSHHVSVNNDLLQLMSASGIFAAVMPKVQFHNAPTPTAEAEANPDDPTDTSNFSSNLYELQLTALGSLQNIIMSLSSSSIPPTHVPDTWKAMCDLCGEALARSNVLPQAVLTPVLISTTAIMNDLLRQNTTANHQLFAMSPQILEGISQLAKTPLSDHIRSNAITMLGISAAHPQAGPHMEAFGRQFLEALSDPSPWVYAEALNAIFDVFPETDHNAAVKALGLVAKLEEFVPYLRQQIQQGKKARMDRILLDRLDEARINLTRFIKYKKQQRM